MNPVMPDANAYAALLLGDEKVLPELEESDRIYFSVIVAGELLAGFNPNNLYKIYNILHFPLDSRGIKGDYPK